VKVKLTVHRRGQRHNLLVTADGTATVGDIAAALASAHPTDPGAAQDPAAVTLRVVDQASGGQGRVLGVTTSLIESGIRSGLTVEVVAAPTASVARGPAAALLRIVQGPGAGAEFALPFGPSRIGRAPDNDIVLRDEMVSKYHARILVGDGVEISDANSANGIVLGGRRAQRLKVGPTDVVTLGETSLTVVQTRQSGQDDLTSADIPFTRSPTVLPAVEPRQVELPEAPKPPEPMPFPYLTMVAPLIMGLVMWLATQSLMSLIFVALSPLLMIGTLLDQRVADRRRLRADVKRFNEVLARHRRDLTAAFAQDRAKLLTIYPSVADSWAVAARLGPVLWWRRPEHSEFLRLRLGLGAIPPLARLQRSGKKDGLEVYEAEIDALIADFAVLDQAPVVADLRSCGSLGLCGPSGVLDGVARGVVIQLVTQHSPAEVAVVALTSGEGVARWNWLQWLPHTSTPHSPLGSLQLAGDAASGAILLARLEELIDSRSRSGAPAPRGSVAPDEKPSAPVLPSVVVLVDEAQVDQARLTRLAERGPDVGVYLIWCAGSVREIPAACRMFLDVDAQGSSVGLVRQHDTITPVQVESVDVVVSDQLGRILAPVWDAGVPVDDSSDLPRAVSMVSLTGHDLADSPEAVIARWKESQSIIDRRPGAPLTPLKRPADLQAVVGHAGTGIFTLDLKTQGPHALVGGTTGAGKSEFLQAWVLGMATGHSPDRLAFLFVDYKGGSAFARCLDLPHVVGLVTDLSPYLVRRALTSLRAELRYREHLLNEKGAKDLAELEQRGDPDCAPSLIIVVDEFAALAGEIPEFVDGVVDVAQRGRSLGMHLIMATQRPAGVIKDNLRANTNLRVALRMADEQDSSDVLGERTAAFFDPATPGRGAAKTGPGRIVQFQSGYPGAKTPAQAVQVPVDIVELTFGPGRPWRVPERKVDLSHLDQDIERLVSTMVQAARQAEIPKPRQPWLADLAPVYDLARLPGHRDDQRLVLGVMDDPEAQQQPVVSYEPDRDGNLAILGSGGSGKTTALRTIAISSVFATRQGGPVWVYGLDFSAGGLSLLEALPNVGAVIRGDDEERVIRLLRTLRDTVEDRTVRFQKVAASTITEYRRLAGAPDEPRIILLVDGMSTFREEYEFGSGPRSAWFTAFAQIAADGRQLGVHVVMTGDRPNAVPQSISSSVQRRVVLRQASEDDYAMMDAPKDVLTPASPPGRGLWDGSEMQFGVLGADPNVAVQTRAVQQLAEAAGLHSPAPPAPGIIRLAEQVALETLPLADAQGYPVIGLADETLAGIGLEPRGALLIAGPPASGRTTALEAVAAAVERHTRAGLSAFTTVLFTPSRSRLVDRLAWGLLARGEEAIAELAEELAEELAGEAAEAGRYAIFIDSLTQFSDTAVEDPLEKLIVAAVRGDQFVVGEGESSTWGQAWTLAKPFKAARRGLVLGDGDAENLTSTDVGRIRAADFPPGRGFLIGGGRAAKVQVATHGN